MDFSWVLLALWGGWVAIDGTSFGQFMLSRPLVACLVAGWIMGAPGEVVVLAMLLEAAHVGVLPVGAARYPEGGPAAVAAGAVLAHLPPSHAAVLTAVVFALAWESISGQTIYWMRGFNGRLVARAPLDAQPRRHAAAIALDFLRGAALTGLGVAAFAVVAAFGLPVWSAYEATARFVLIAALAALLAASARLLHERARFWAAGMAAGALYLIVL